MKKIYLTSLGCAKNLVDSERFLASAVGGLELEPAGEIEKADLVVINTCAFLQSAVEEALDCIMETGRRKKAGAKVAVLGCLPARYRGDDGEDLAKGLPEVDLWLPPEEYQFFEDRIAALLNQPALGEAKSSFSNGLPAQGRLIEGRVAATPFFRSYLKISEGCDNRCTYCLIPRLRGPLKSYPLSGLLAEAEELAAAGVRELTLVAQDLTAYGQDRQEPKALSTLAEGLSKIKGLDWIRLLYAYPERLNETLIKDLASIPKILPYLDLPFQHVSADILKLMGRRRSAGPATSA